MSHSFTLEMTLSRTANRKVLKGEVADEPWKRLVCYREEADRLVDALLSCDSREVNVQIAVRYGLVTARSETPSPRDRATLLHALRPFVLERELWSFDRTCGLTGQLFVHSWMRRAVVWLRDHYRSVHFQSKLAVMADGVMLNAERTFKNWLNGFEYHRDQDCRASIEALEAKLPAEMSQGIFFGVLLDKAHSIIGLRHIIHRIELADGNPLEIALAANGKKDKLLDATDPEVMVLKAT